MWVNGAGSKDKHRSWLIAMIEKIEETEKLFLVLKELGKGVPVVETNVSNILSFLFVLKFGISDVADITAEERS